MLKVSCILYYKCFFMNMKILGNIEPGPNFWPLNFILLVTRHYIFTRAKKFGKLNIYHLQSILKKKKF